MAEQQDKVAIITGANAGVGLGIVQRLLESQENGIIIIMACRNREKARLARKQLLIQFPDAQIDIEIVDMNSIESVIAFCRNIQAK